MFIGDDDDDDDAIGWIQEWRRHTHWLPTRARDGVRSRTRGCLARNEFLSLKAGRLCVTESAHCAHTLKKEQKREREQKKRAELPLFKSRYKRNSILHFTILLSLIKIASTASLLLDYILFFCSLFCSTYTHQLNNWIESLLFYVISH